MSLMPEYDATAGFPAGHVNAFERIAQQGKDVEAAFGHGAEYVPLHISDARLKKLQERNVIKVASQPDQSLLVTASPGGQRAGVFRFRLIRTKTNPPCADAPMWGIYYETGEKPELARGRQAFSIPNLAAAGGLTPVTGLANPKSESKLGVKAAVAGDYDLWCVFPHSTVKGAGIQDRAMPLRAAINPKASPLIKDRAAQAGLVYKSAAEKAGIAGQREDKHLGNISLGIMKVRSTLNAAITASGYTGGDVVQHSDYGGNPFGDIDYPLIFFIPSIGANGMATGASHALVSNLNDLKTQLREITKQGFDVKLNPQWTVPNF